MPNLLVNEVSATKCIVCDFNQNKKYIEHESKYWQIDISPDLTQNGLFFIKTKRHVEHMADLNENEYKEVGKLLKEYSQKSMQIAHAFRVLNMSLKLKDPHAHFWIIPITKENEENTKAISAAVKNFLINLEKN